MRYPIGAQGAPGVQGGKLGETSYGTGPFLKSDLQE